MYHTSSRIVQLTFNLWISQEKEASFNGLRRYIKFQRKKDFRDTQKQLTTRPLDRLRLDFIRAVRDTQILRFT